MYRPFVGPFFSFFSSLDEITEVIPCVRFVIRQNGRIFLERTPVLSDGISLVTSFIEVFPCFPRVIAATDQPDNTTKLHIFRYNNAEKP